MEDLRAIEKLMKINMKVEGGVPWSADLAGPARAEQRKRGQPQRRKPQGGGARGDKPKASGKPAGGGQKRRRFG